MVLIEYKIQEVQKHYLQISCKCLACRNDKKQKQTLFFSPPTFVGNFYSQFAPRGSEKLLKTQVRSFNKL